MTFDIKAKPDFNAMNDSDLLKMSNALVHEIISRGLKGYRESIAFRDHATAVAFCEDRWSALRVVRNWK